MMAAVLAGCSAGPLPDDDGGRASDATALDGGADALRDGAADGTYARATTLPAAIPGFGGSSTSTSSLSHGTGLNSLGCPPDRPFMSSGTPGSCTTCTVGATCETGNTCTRGIVSACGSERAVCSPNGPSPMGTACGLPGAGQSCDGVHYGAMAVPDGGTPDDGCHCPSGQGLCGTLPSNSDAICMPVGSQCSAGIGECFSTGSVVCSGVGPSTICNAQANRPQTETCNGKDDDCNGTVDDIPATACAPVPCRSGSAYCSGGAGPFCAYSANQPVGSSCSQPLGGMCDGTATCVCPPGQASCNGTCFPVGSYCSQGVGACLRAGTIQCAVTGTGTQCLDGTGNSVSAGSPTTETCNNIDDDCNGRTDDLWDDNGTGLEGDYFSNETLSGARTIGRLDPQVNFDWALGSPHADIPVDQFSVRWTGQIQPRYSETYTFYVTADDGARLWVNNVLVLDSWAYTNGSPRTSATIALVATNRYDIKLEFHDNSFSAVAKLEWSSASQAREYIPTSQLYPPVQGVKLEIWAGDQNLSTSTPTLTRYESTIFGQWYNGPPGDSTLGSDNFSDRWTTQIRAPLTGTYTFNTYSDDGIRLWVNNQLIINDWTLHGPTNDTGTIALTQGQLYPVRMEHFENGGEAEAQLTWKRPSDSTFSQIPLDVLVASTSARLCNTPGSDCRGGFPYCNGNTSSCTYSYNQPAGIPCTQLIGGVCNGAGACVCPSGYTNCGGTCWSGIGNACTNGVGQCQNTGVYACSGNTRVCTAGTGTPSTEVCNGLDDNCDGTVDNITPVACSPAQCVNGMTACQSGSQVCQTTSNTASGTTCTQPVGGNCNGGGSCVCPSGTTACGPAGAQQCLSTGAACNVGVGACLRSGQTRCNPNGAAATACVNTVTNTVVVAGASSPEICDNIDNNCDTYTDNAVATNSNYTLQQACYSGNPVTTNGVGVCIGGQQLCSYNAALGVAAYGACIGQVVPSAETCNLADDNCNGQCDDDPGLSSCRVGIIHSVDPLWVSGENYYTTDLTLATGTGPSGGPYTVQGYNEYYMYAGPVTGQPNLQAIHGCYPASGSKVHYLSLGACSAGDNDTLLGYAWTQNGASTPPCNAVKLWRYRNTTTGNRLYTITQGTIPSGWVDDSAAGGFTWYVWPGDGYCAAGSRNCHGVCQTVGTGCNVGTGACGRSGYLVCDPVVALTTCSVTAGAAGTESCNGIDDDCDGRTDNYANSTFALSQYCSSNACTNGYSVCNSATHAYGTCTACTGATNTYWCPTPFVPNGTSCPQPVSGTCNGTGTCVCQGVLNTTCGASGAQQCFATGAACGTGVGACFNSGNIACNPNGLASTACVKNGTVVTAGTPTAEVCDNIDNNCDTYTDNAVLNAGPNYSLTQACYTGTPAATQNVGVCIGGTQTCTLNGSATAAAYGACNGQVTPQANDASCNLADDDCNGACDDSPLIPTCRVGIFWSNDASWNNGAPASNGGENYYTNSLTNATSNGPSGSVYALQAFNYFYLYSTGVAGRSNLVALNGCYPASTTKMHYLTTGTCTVGDTAQGSIGYVWEQATSAATPPCGAVRLYRFRNTVTQARKYSTSSTSPGVSWIDDSTVDSKYWYVFPNDGYCSAANQQNCGGVCSTVGATNSSGVQCQAGVGACQRNGYNVCNTMGTGASCNAAAGAASSETCDNADNNCDGYTDNAGAMAANYTLTQQCYPFSVTPPNPTLAQLPIGICRQGTQFCSSSAGYTACTTTTDPANATTTIARGPAAETCNGYDDDCNGVVDNGVTTNYYKDCDGDGHGTGTNYPACSAAAAAGAVCNGHTGVTSNDDCNDAVASTYPGAAESCNSVDDNCNGLTDDGVVTNAFYRDADGDTFGDSTGTVAPPGNGRRVNDCHATLAGYVLNNTDCNDANAAVKPGATETCNGVDDNCDTYIDNASGMNVANTITQACYSGSAGTQNVGLCHGGTQTCTNGTFGACNGQVTPTVAAGDVCNMQDDDCDGTCDDQLSATNSWACRQGIYWSKDASWNGGEDQYSSSIISAMGYGPSGSRYAVQGFNYFFVYASSVAAPNVNGSVSTLRLCQTVVNGTAGKMHYLTIGACASGETDSGVQGYIWTQSTNSAATVPCGASLLYRYRNGTTGDRLYQTTAMGSVVAPWVDDTASGGLYWYVWPNDGACTATNFQNCGSQCIKVGATNNLGATCNAGVGACNYAGYYVCSGSTNPSSTCSATPNTPNSETCNNVDDNCNGVTDEDPSSPGVARTLRQTCYPYGSPALASLPYGICKAGYQTCNVPSGATYVYNACPTTTLVTDVTPANARGPATEICNGYDDNCNGVTDEGTLISYYPDCDGDGHGANVAATQACSPPTSCGRPMVTTNDDCNDASATVYTGRAETCDSVDNNCNGTTDEGLTQYTLYRDQDVDGYGNSTGTVAAGTAVTSCYATVAGFVVDHTDCDDLHAAAHPGLTDTCDGLDNDCDGRVDNVAGTATILTLACYPGPGGTQNVGICRGTTITCTSGAFATCNSATPGVVVPGTETCNGLDDNCNGTTDEGVQSTWYRDQDGDGYGDPTMTTLSCTMPSGYVANNTDCANNNGRNDYYVHLNAPELCDNKDNDCNGTVDDAAPQGAASTSASAVTCPNGTLCTGGSSVVCGTTPNANHWCRATGTYPNTAAVGQNNTSGANCLLSTCAAGTFDVNSNYSDGCECADTVLSVDLGSLTVAGASAARSDLIGRDYRPIGALNLGAPYNLVAPSAATDDVYFAHFPAGASAFCAGPTYAGRPRVQLTAGQTLYHFAITSTSAAPIVCTQGNCAVTAYPVAQADMPSTGYAGGFNTAYANNGLVSASQTGSGTYPLTPAMAATVGGLGNPTAGLVTWEFRDFLACNPVGLGPCNELSNPLARNCQTRDPSTPWPTDVRIEVFPIATPASLTCANLGYTLSVTR